MNKIELTIMAISRSVTQTKNYAVILGEVDGSRRLPVIIGAAEAQAIAVAIEGMDSPRPMTHDLFRNTLLVMEANLSEVIINNLHEGIFFSKLVITQNGAISEVDSRTSDAIALAIRFDCPIYTYESILDTAGVVLENEEDQDDEEIVSAADSKDHRKGKLGSYTLGELQEILEEMLQEENYERAAQIRDEINRRKTNG